MYNLTSQTLSTSTPSFVFQNTIPIRTVITESGEPLFCLADVCCAMEALPPSDVARQIKGEFKVSVLNTAPFETSGGRKNLIVITEPQLYFVMMRERTNKAHEFRQWVCNEVIPAIRKIVSYQTTAKAPQEVRVRELMENASYLLEKAGITGNQLALSLDQLHKAETGKSLLALTGTVLETPQQEQLLTIKQICKKFCIAPQSINQVLEELGLQKKTSTGWEPTEAGLKKGGTFVDVGEDHGQVIGRELKWPSSIVDEISDKFLSEYNLFYRKK